MGIIQPICTFLPAGSSKEKRKGWTGERLRQSTNFRLPTPMSPVQPSFAAAQSRAGTNLGRGQSMYAHRLEPPAKVGAISNHHSQPALEPQAKPHLYLPLTPASYRRHARVSPGFPYNLCSCLMLGLLAGTTPSFQTLPGMTLLIPQVSPLPRRIALKNSAMRRGSCGRFLSSSITLCKAFSLRRWTRSFF